MERYTGRNEKGDLTLCGKQVYGNNPNVYNAISLLEDYEKAGLLPDEIPRWIPVSKRLPEDDESLPRYSDSTMDAISVFACGYLNGDDKLSIEEVNRLLIKKTGIRQIDEQHTGKWEWSKHFKEIVYWQPLPAAPKEEK